MRSPAELEIRPLGDAAMIIEIGDREVASDASLADVLRVARVLAQRELPGVDEITTAFTSVALFYDPARIPRTGDTIFDSLEALVRSALAEGDSLAARTGPERDVTAIPVCYEAEFALDLEDVAAHCGLAVDDVVRLHSSVDYCVACIGFTPGFPYLSGLPAELAVPRRATPRTAVAAGSVGIGGSQTGIYPSSSPGGWQIIGRTPLRLFDPLSASPALLRAGDRVRFRAISGEEFRAAAAAEAHDAVQASANK